MNILKCYTFLILSYNAFCKVIISSSTVLQLNQPTKINCTSTINPPVWAFNGVTIAGSLGGPCKIQSGGAGLITSVDAPNDKTCNLVFSSVGLQHAGNYACADGNTYLTTFRAIIADRLKCEVNATVTSISNPVTLKCSATMSSNGNPETQISWTPTVSTTATASSSLNDYVDNIFSSTFTTQLNPANPAACIPTYTCSIRMDKYNYEDSCNTPAINVYFPVCCMKFSNDNATKHGTSLVCSVSANPPAIITLKNSNGTMLDECFSPTTNQLACPITQEDKYTCTASTSGNLAGDNTIIESVYIIFAISSSCTYVSRVLLVIIVLLTFLVVIVNGVFIVISKYYQKKIKKSKNSGVFKRRINHKEIFCLNRNLTEMSNNHLFDEK